MVLHSRSFTRCWSLQCLKCLCTMLKMFLENQREEKFSLALGFMDRSQQRLEIFPLSFVIFSSFPTPSAASIHKVFSEPMLHETLKGRWGEVKWSSKTILEKHRDFSRTDTTAELTQTELSKTADSACLFTLFSELWFLLFWVGKEHMDSISTLRPYFSQQWLKYLRFKLFFKINKSK